MYGVRVNVKERGRGGIEKSRWEKRIVSPDMDPIDIGVTDWLYGDFDTAVLGEQVFTAMELLKMEEIATYSAIIRFDHSRATNTTVTLNDLSPSEWDRTINSELKNLWKRYQRYMDIEVIVVCVASSLIKRAVNLVDELTVSPTHRRTRTTV